MKKKPVHKVHARRAVRKPKRNGHYVEFFGLGIGMLIGVLSIVGYNSADRPYVLGTNVFLESDAAVLGEGETQATESSEKSLENYEQPSDKGASDLPKYEELPPQKVKPPQGEGANIAPGTLVDCVNPAGKHVQMSFKACQKLNQKANKQNFSFTELKTSGKEVKMPPPAKVEQKPTEKKESEVIRQKNKISVPPETQLQKKEIEITKGEERIQLKQKSEQGDTELGEKDLAELNNQLGDERIHLRLAENKNVIFRRNQVEAQTPYPLSVDPTTNKFSVTLPSGKKDISVMPDEAVERLLQKRTLSAIEKQASASGENGEDATLQTTLTELNNKPVFRVKGFSNKKVLGLFPASFAKTVYVSAEDGSVVKTDETFLSKFVEAVSF